jgi:hypothetical protein
MKSWAGACRELGAWAPEGNARKSAAYFVKLGKLHMVPIAFEGLVELPDDEILRKMRAARDELAKFVWKGPETGYAKL